MYKCYIQNKFSYKIAKDKNILFHIINSGNVDDIQSAQKKNVANFFYVPIFGDIQYQVEYFILYRNDKRMWIIFAEFSGFDRLIVLSYWQIYSYLERDVILKRVWRVECL